MNIPPVTNNQTAVSDSPHNLWGPHNPWGPGELPPGPPVLSDSPLVKSLGSLFPKENSEELSKHAYKFYENMMGVLTSLIAYDLKKARERARKMREAI